MTYLDPSGSQLGHKESVADTAAVLGRMYDAIEFRGNSQADVEELAAHAGVPVYNGLTNEWHPTQMLADFLTMHEASGKPYHGLTYAYVGDCRFNMGRSLLVIGALMGSDVRLSGPAELHPPEDVVDLARDIGLGRHQPPYLTDRRFLRQEPPYHVTQVLLLTGKYKSCHNDRASCPSIPLHPDAIDIDVDFPGDNPASRGGCAYRRSGWSRKASTCWLNRSGWSTLHTWPASGIAACAARGSLAAMYSAAPR